MNSTNSPKIEFGKKAVIKKNDNGYISTISENLPSGIKIKIIHSGTSGKAILGRAQINLKNQNRRNAYQRINKKLGEN